MGEKVPFQQPDGFEELRKVNPGLADRVDAMRHNKKQQEKVLLGSQPSDLPLNKGIEPRRIFPNTKPIGTRTPKELEELRRQGNNRQLSKSDQE